MAYRVLWGQGEQAIVRHDDGANFLYQFGRADGVVAYVRADSAVMLRVYEQGWANYQGFLFETVPEMHTWWRYRRVVPQDASQAA